MELGNISCMLMWNTQNEIGVTDLMLLSGKFVAVYPGISAEITIGPKSRYNKLFGI